MKLKISLGRVEHVSMGSPSSGKRDIPEKEGKHFGGLT
jgi:hypothetical protein